MNKSKFQKPIPDPQEDTELSGDYAPSYLNWENHDQDESEKAQIRSALDLLGE